MSRDFGLDGAGKGDADRTTNVKKFQENLAAINFHPEVDSGFKKVGTGRFKKSYGKPAPKPEPLSDELLSAMRAARSGLGGSSDH